MPVVAANGDVFQVRIVGRIDGQETNNILYFRNVNGDTDVWTHLILVLANCAITHLLPVLSSNWSLEKIKYQKVSPVLGLEYEGVPAGSGAGSGNAACLPSFCSALISTRTTRPGRSGRGRMFIPGIPENQTVNSTLDSGAALWAALLAFAACILTSFTPGDPPAANSWMWMLYSRKIGGATLPYGAGGFAQVTEATPRSLVASTRSRKVGRGS